MDYIGYDFKNIHVIPSKAEFIDLVLARTQSKIPIVLKGYPISAILKMCIRKLNFIKQTISDKTQQILNDFPILGVCLQINSIYLKFLLISLISKYINDKILGNSFFLCRTYTYSLRQE